MNARRLIAAIGALSGALALVLQYAILQQNLGHDGVGGFAVFWRFAGYFTILTNVFVTTILAGAAFWVERRSVLNTPRVEAMGATAIIFVGAVYHLLLAKLWSPQGAQLLADILLHSAAPALFALFWLISPHGRLKRADIGYCMIWPLAYCAYALARGAGDGWYAYPFIDASQLTPAALAFNIAGLGGAFAVGAALLVLIDRWLGGRALNQPALARGR